MTLFLNTAYVLYSSHASLYHFLIILPMIASKHLCVIEEDLIEGLVTPWVLLRLVAFQCRLYGEYSE